MDNIQSITMPYLDMLPEESPKTSPIHPDRGLHQEQAPPGTT